MYLPLKALVFVLACSVLVLAAPAPVSEWVEERTLGMRWTAPGCGGQYDLVNVVECTPINSTQAFRGSKEGFCILYRDAACTDRYRRVPAHGCNRGKKAQSFRCYHAEATWAYKWRNFFEKFKKPKKNKQTKTKGAATASAVAEEDEDLEQEVDASDVDIETENDDI